jgi:hypothetical protein
MKPQLLSGARGQVSIAGKVLAYITDVSIDVPASVRPVHTFGSVNARSVEPLQAGPCSVSIGRVIPVADADGAAVNTSMINEGIEPTLAAMMTSGDITVELIDKVTGVTYASVRNCRFAGRSFSMSASQLATERIQLMGIYDAGRVTASGGSTNTPGTLGF